MHKSGYSAKSQESAAYPLRFEKCIWIWAVSLAIRMRLAQIPWRFISHIVGMHNLENKQSSDHVEVALWYRKVGNY